MGLVSVERDNHRRLIATLAGSDKFAPLGMNWGFYDEGRAQAESCPVYAHQVFELALQLVVQKELPLDFNYSIATATLASNYHLPKQIQHLHPDKIIWDTLKENTEAFSFSSAVETELAIGWFTKYIVYHPELLDNSTTSRETVLSGLSGFHKMLKLDGHKFKASHFTVNNDGQLVHK